MKSLMILLLIAVSFLTCTKSDQCKDSSCKNGGVCLNGDCDCPDNYHGVDCSEQTTPTNIIMNTITISSVPATDNGAGWDLTSGPDIFVIITDLAGTELINTRSSFKQNSFNGFYQINWIIPDVTAFYNFSVYDYDDDLSADDFMGSIQSRLYSSTNGFPGVITLECAACVVSFSAPLVYTW